MTDVAPPTEPAAPTAERTAPAPVARLLAAGRRLPFTALMFLTMLVLAIVTGGLWSRLETRSWYIDIAYGVPVLRGRSLLDAAHRHRFSRPAPWRTSAS